MIALLPWVRWILAIHVMADIAWMAAMFYLPRLFVYHCEVEPGTTEDIRFQTMERKLLRAIMTPAMIVATLCGATLAAIPGLIDWEAGWWWAKLLAILAMFAMHGLCSRWRRDFAAGRNARPARFYRIANEVPTVLMVVIVIAIIVRP